MAKKKVHTNHNQGHKNHRNGIHKVRRNRYESLKAVIPPSSRHVLIVCFVVQSKIPPQSQTRTKGRPNHQEGKELDQEDPRPQEG